MTVKLYVVVAEAPDSVPVIVALVAAEFKDNPPGKAPDVIAKEAASVAEIVIVPTFAPALNVPRDPAAVVHDGSSETVRTADVCTALPSGFSMYKRYVPSTGKVNLTVICDAELKATSSADTLAPVDELIAVTRGTDTNVPPAITQVVCAFVITFGVIDENVGLVSVVSVIDPPKATAEPLIVIDPEPVNLAFATVPVVTCVPLRFVIFAPEVAGKVVGNVKVAFATFNVVPAGKVIVSLDSPICRAVPDCGMTLSTSI